MQEAIQGRDAALLTLQDQIYELSKLFKESYLSIGSGAIIVHTHLLEASYCPSMIDYSTRCGSIELFDDENSRSKLASMIDGYDPNSEGILVLITKSNATWFIKVKLKFRDW